MANLCCGYVVFRFFILAFCGWVCCVWMFSVRECRGLICCVLGYSVFVYFVVRYVMFGGVLCSDSLCVC